MAISINNINIPFNKNAWNVIKTVKGLGKGFDLTGSKENYITLSKIFEYCLSHHTRGSTVSADLRKISEKLRQRGEIKTSEFFSSLESLVSICFFKVMNHESKESQLASFLCLKDLLQIKTDQPISKKEEIKNKMIHLCQLAFFFQNEFEIYLEKREVPKLPTSPIVLKKPSEIKLTLVEKNFYDILLNI